MLRKILYDGQVYENIYNDKGQIIQSYSYHIDNPTSKIYNKNVTLDELGNVLYEEDALGHKTTYKYKENSSLVRETIDANGNKTNFGYSIDDRLLNCISTNVLGRTNCNKNFYNCDLLTGVTSNNNEFGYVYDGYGNVIETKVNDIVLLRSNSEDIIEPQLQETGEYKDVVVGEKITKTLASKEIFVIYKNTKGITYRIEYYENENADVEVILNNQVDLVGNIIEVNDKSNNMKYTFDYNEEGNIETTKYNQNGKEIIISNTKEDDYKTIKKITINGNTREEKYIYSKDLNSYLEDIQLSNGSVINQKLDQLNRVKSISIDNNSRTFEYLQNGDSVTNLITDEWKKRKKFKYNFNKRRKKFFKLLITLNNPYGIRTIDC